MRERAKIKGGSICNYSMKPKIEAIDLFCGAGGLTYGLAQAGIKVLAGLDADGTCRYAYEKNNDSEFIHEDIIGFDFKKLKKLFSKNSIKVLAGCAPCQPFSSHTFKVKKDDVRKNLLAYFTDAISVINPDIIFMENVREVVKKDVFADFYERAQGLNYKIDYRIVKCSDYGIPQKRYRLIFLASKLGDIKIPEPKKKKITIKDFIKNLPKLKSGQSQAGDELHRACNLSEVNKERIKQSKPNGTWMDWDEQILPDCYKKATGKTYTSVYGRMSWDDVAPTITTQFFRYGSGRFGHPEQDRALSLREGALLQTFPKSYDFGDISFANTGKHIGNAVPPHLGKIIGEKIVKHVREQ